MKFFFHVYPLHIKVFHGLKCSLDFFKNENYNKCMFIITIVEPSLRTCDQGSSMTREGNCESVSKLLKHIPTSVIECKNICPNLPNAKDFENLDMNYKDSTPFQGY